MVYWPPPASSYERHSSLARLAPVLGAPFLFFVTLPLVVYALNADSVGVPKRAILESGLVTTAVAATVLWLLTLVPRFGRTVAVACDVLAIALFVLILVPNRTGEITGFDDPFTGLGNRGPLLKLAALIALAALVHRFRPRSLRALAQTVVATAAVGSLAVALFVSSAVDRSRHGTQEEARRLFALGTKSNVIVLVLDSFTGYRMVEIVEKRPEIRAALAGFTLYPRAIAPAHNSPAGSSAMLTGDLRYAIEIEREGERNTRSLESSFLTEAQLRGLDVAYVSGLHAQSATVPSADEGSLLPIERTYFPMRARLYLELLATSTARVLPERVVRAVARLSSRAQSFGDDGTETELALLKRVTNPAVRNPLVGKLAFDRLLSTLHVGHRENKVLFVFTALSHPPWNFTEAGRFEIGAGPISSSIFFARSIVHLVDRLRELAALDDSLVIVASDHGTLPILDASMGGVFAPEHRLPRELNALVMVKPPHADQPLRISKMTVWLGDVAATVRDALDLPQPANPAFESRSLLLAEDPDRVLALPVFFRPDQVSYHAVLSEWVRVDVHGTFAEFGKAASLDPRALLSRRAKIVLRTGTDAYATQLAAQGLMDGEGTLSSSWIEIDGRRIGKVMNEGAVTLSDETGRFRIRQVQGAQAGSVSLSSTEPARNHFAAAVGIPRRLVPRHVADTPPAARDDELLNCVLVASERSRPRAASRCSRGDLALELEWP